MILKGGIEVLRVRNRKEAYRLRVRLTRSGLLDKVTKRAQAVRPERAVLAVLPNVLNRRPARHRGRNNRNLFPLYTHTSFRIG